jgi:hypothetical protein
MTIPADPLYQHLLLTAEKKFARCVETGETPHLFGIEPPWPQLEAVRVVDMSGSNSWAAHLRFAQARGLGLRTAPDLTLPFCRACHAKRAAIPPRWPAQEAQLRAVRLSVRELTPFRMKPYHRSTDSISHKAYQLAN